MYGSHMYQIQNRERWLINLTRNKRDTSIQYRHQKKDEIKGYIPKLVAHPEYGAVYQHP